MNIFALVIPEVNNSFYSLSSIYISIKATVCQFIILFIVSIDNDSFLIRLYNNTDVPSHEIKSDQTKSNPRVTTQYTINTWKSINFSTCKICNIPSWGGSCLSLCQQSITANRKQILLSSFSRGFSWNFLLKVQKFNTWCR